MTQTTMTINDAFLLHHVNYYGAVFYDG